MIQLIALLLAGFLSGFLLRKRKLKWVPSLLTGSIWVLLFLLGLEIGANPMVMDHLHTIGWLAAVLAVAAVLGSVLMAWGLWRVVRTRANTSARPAAPPAPSAPPAQASAHVPPASPAPRPSAESSPSAPAPSAPGRSLAPQLLLLFFFLAGVLLSYGGLIPKTPTNWNLSFYALCVLLFLVGLGVGNDTQTLRQFRTMDRRLLWLPLTTAIGTFAAVSLMGWITTLTVPDSLAVGSGFAYYSLSSILITEYKGAYLGTIALLANVFRELITLLGTPWLRRGFGPLAPIASGGATTMDTTLPVIVKYCGPSYTLLAVYHAMVLDFSVPFLVTFFCQL